MARTKFTCAVCGVDKPFTSAVVGPWRNADGSYSGVCDDEQCMEMHGMYGRHSTAPRSQLERLRSGE